MGERGWRREPSTDEDRREMARLTVRRSRGRRVRLLDLARDHPQDPGRRAHPDARRRRGELAVIGDAMRRAGKAGCRSSPTSDDPVEEFKLLRRVGERAGVPISLTLAQREGKTGHWKLLLDLIEQANRDGVPMLAQILGRQIGTNFGFEITRTRSPSGRAGRPSRICRWRGASSICAIRSSAPACSPRRPSASR